MLCSRVAAGLGARSWAISREASKMERCSPAPKQQEATLRGSITCSLSKLSFKLCLEYLTHQI